jgi:putative ferrous iron transport protein C
MILSELRDYLAERRRASMRDLTHRFDNDPEVLRDMLNRWIDKGRLRRAMTVNACSDAGKSSCTGCGSGDPLLAEIYEWVDRT